MAEAKIPYMNRHPAKTKSESVMPEASVMELKPIMATQSMTFLFHLLLALAMKMFEMA